MARELKEYQLIERSIVKKYRKTIWNPFIEAVKKYQLIEPNDKIAVCISGGKDSMLLAKLMQQLQRYSEIMGKYSCTVPVLEQYVLAEFIKSGNFERHLNRMRRRLAKE